MNSSLCPQQKWHLPRHGFLDGKAHKNVPLTRMVPCCAQKTSQIVEKGGKGPRSSKKSSENSAPSDGDSLEFLTRAEMEAWLKSRPARGFGGSAASYADEEDDFSLEDELLEQIRREKEGIQKPRKGASVPGAAPPAKASVSGAAPPAPVRKVKQIPEGPQVTLTNLPKKRKVERDLKAQIGNVAGLVHIHPLTSGTLKTRDPTCIGKAILVFSNLRSAKEFVEEFQDSYLKFGKVEKRVKCALVTKVKSSEGIRDADAFSSASLSASELAELEREAESFLAGGESAQRELYGLSQTGKTVSKLPVRFEPKPAVSPPVASRAQNDKLKTLGSVEDTVEDEDDDEDDLVAEWDALEDEDDLDVDKEMDSLDSEGDFGVDDDDDDDDDDDVAGSKYADVAGGSHDGAMSSSVGKEKGGSEASKRKLVRGIVESVSVEGGDRIAELESRVMAAMKTKKVVDAEDEEEEEEGEEEERIDMGTIRKEMQKRDQKGVDAATTEKKKKKNSSHGKGRASSIPEEQLLLRSPKASKILDKFVSKYGSS